MTGHPDLENAPSSPMPHAERHRLLVEWNRTATDYPRDATVPELFQRQAQRTPEELAVVFEDRRLSYGELNRRANQLAHRLRGLGVGVDSPVGVLLERSAEMVWAWLGVLKAGGAYVPLDPSYPEHRLDVMLRDAQPSVVITTEALRNKVSGYRGPTLCLDRARAHLDREPPTHPTVALSATNLAYVMYTSGSTGQPKGITIPHRGILRLVCNTDYIAIRPTDRIAQASNASFDAATFEVWGALLHGARLVGVRREITLNPRAYAAFLEEQGITVVFVTTALFNQMAREAPGAFRGVRVLLFGGEAADPDSVRRVLANHPPRRLLHVYGPTETTTFATWHRVRAVPEEATTVPIGGPIANTQVYVLNEHLEPVPVGAVGELYIGGDGLARGYLKRPELTAERFVPHPFAEEPGARLYKTGDTVRRRDDGSIEFVGRVDHQVKVRGFRIELGEIEAALARHPGVHEAIVLAREDEPGDKRLVAYLVPGREGEPSAGELRGHLERILPGYMIPAAFVALEAWPLTPNGKVDRAALPAPDWANRAAFVPPSSGIEEALARIYSEVLGVDPVGSRDSFYDLGGHSLNAIQIAARVRDRFHVELPVEAVFATPVVCELAARIEADVRRQQAPAPSSIQPAPRDEPLPLSYSQERVWFIQHMEDTIRAYHFQTIIEMEGALDADALERSLSEMVRRHEILRTTFPLVGDRPVQHIHPPRPVRLPVVDLRGLADPDRDAEARRRAGAEFRKPFDLTRLPLVRWVLFRVRDDRHLLAHVEHHIIHDGWSFNVFLGELFEIYRAFSEGRPSPLPDPPIQFADFAYWQRRWMEGEEAATQLEYWREQLAGNPPLLELPYDHPRPPTQRYRGTALRARLPGELVERLAQLGREAGATPFMTLLTGFVALLHRYSGQSDLCVGTGMAGRRWRETEGLLGMVINNVVLRSRLEGNLSLRELLGQVRTATLAAAANQDIPFDTVVTALQPQRSLGHNPLFQVLFDLHDAPMPDPKLPGLSGTIDLGVNNGSAKFDMTVIGIPDSAQRFGQSRGEASDGMTLFWEYSTDLFDADTISRMFDHYQRILTEMVADPDRPVATVPLLSPGERHRLLVEWNRTTTAYPRQATIHGLFEEQANRTPDAVAVACGGRQWTYAQLNQRANRLARHLRRLGVGPEVVVGLCCERSPEMVIGLLGILKAGGAYLPLDPEYPTRRLEFMLQDTRAPVLLTQGALRARLPAYAGRVVCLDSAGGAFERERPDNPDVAVTARNLAYVMYTSGSTGRPKGTCIEHRSVVRLVRDTNYVELGPKEVFLQFAPISFDASTFELWGSLLNGAKLVVFPPGPASLEELARGIRDQGVTVLWLTAALFHEMVDRHLDSLKTVRQLLAGGEALSAAHVRRMLQALGDRRLINGYGPTENTTFTTCHAMTAACPVGHSVPIGVPIANTQVYILDGHLQPVPVGVYGELHVGGDGLARGYWNRPGLTAERFIPNPFSSKPGSRLYKTGDTARYRADGTIEFLGRRDHQVKLRGYRIELGEIEVALGEHPAVEQAVVACREDVPGHPRLVAYLILSPGEGKPADDFRGFLRERLPAYMVPSAFVVLEALPLTPNGKVDRGALPAPDGTQAERSAAVVPPRTETEQSIAAVWGEVLGVEDLSVDDDFFALGGHSLLATRVMSRLRERFRLELPISRLFEAPTIAGLARCVEATRWGAGGREGASPLSDTELEEGEL